MTEDDRIRLVLSGHTEAFAYFLDRYADATHRLVAGIVGRPEEAEEITQDAFVQAFEHLASFRGDCRFSTWLYRIAYRLALRHSGHDRHETASPDNEALDNLPDEFDPAAFGEEEAETDRVERLRRALDSLPPDERTLIALFYDEERPAAEIAHIMGLSEANVRTRLCRIRKKLFVKLQTDEKDS